MHRIPHGDHHDARGDGDEGEDVEEKSCEGHGGIGVPKFLQLVHLDTWAETLHDVGCRVFSRVSFGTESDRRHIDPRIERVKGLASRPWQFKHFREGIPFPTPLSGSVPRATALSFSLYDSSKRRVGHFSPTGPQTQCGLRRDAALQRFDVLWGCGCHQRQQLVRSAHSLDACAWE